jgi:cation transport ATPase
MIKYSRVFSWGVYLTNLQAAASVGVAMGAGGSAIAVTAADVVLLSDNLMLLPRTFALARQAKSIILQNCIFAVCIKLLSICLALAGNLSIQ